MDLQRFEEKTFEELIQTAKTIKEKTGQAGFAIPTSGTEGGWIFANLAWNFGVKFMDKVDGKWKATFNTPEAVEAFQYLSDLKWKYKGEYSMFKKKYKIFISALICFSIITTTLSGFFTIAI